MKNSQYFRVTFFVAGSGFITLGVGYYLWFRSLAPAFLQYFTGLIPVDIASMAYLSNAPLTTNSLNWWPTFVHVIGLSLLNISVCRMSARQCYLIIGFWFVINVLFELGQIVGLPGTFDLYDLVAALGAGLVTIVIVGYIVSKQIDGHGATVCGTEGAIRKRFRSAVPSVAGVLVIGFGIVSIGGSYTYCLSEDSNSSTCTDEYGNKPIYMSYEELRTNAIRTEQDVSLTKTGKIYLYQDYLLVNTPNEGIHVYDNGDKQNPVHVTFINIPGNLDIAVKQGNLYVDSYIDLVILDISDINNIREIHRVTDVFPYDPYQNIPSHIYLGPVDSSKGVVVGYREYN